MPSDIKRLSRASKQLREVCLLSLFCRIKIRFSKAGFNKLKNLIKLDTCYYIISFTYIVPELLKTNKYISYILKVYQNYANATYSCAKILDFNRFKSNLLTPNSYVKTAKDLYDAGNKADEYPLYIVIYETIYSTCKEQRSIVNNSFNLSVLLSTFKALPRLTDVGLAFYRTIEREDQLLSSFALNIVVIEESYKYYIQVTSEALQRTKNGGVTIYTINLSFFNLLYYYTWEVSNLSTLSESLRKLLESIKVLRLIDSSSALKLLSYYALDLYQLNLCRIVTKYNTLKDFLETNKRLICSISFYNVKTHGLSQLEGSLSKLSSNMLCKMLKVPLFTLYQAANCVCRSQKRGWRLLLHNDHLQWLGPRGPPVPTEIHGDFGIERSDSARNKPRNVNEIDGFRDYSGIQGDGVVARYSKRPIGCREFYSYLF